MFQRVSHILLAGGLFLGGCIGKVPPPDPDALPVGALLPFTGTNSASGSNLERALRLAVEQVNAGGGVSGHPLRLVARDSGNTPAQGLDRARELLDGEKAVALMGPESEDLAEQLAPLVAERSVVQISGGLVSPRFTTLADGDFCFRTCPSALQLGAALADRMAADGVKKAVLIHMPGAYGEGFSAALTSAMASRGISTGSPLQIDAGQASHGSLIQIALQREPDAVVMVAFAEVAAALALEWSAVGGTMKWYLPPSLMYQVFPDNLPPSLVEGMVGVGAAVQDRDAFAAAFRDRWLGEEPTTGAAYYYDALAVWALAAEAAFQETGELTPEVIRVKMRSVSSPAGEKVGWHELGRALELVRKGQEIDYVGASGEVDLNEWGEPAATSTFFWTIREGRIVAE